MPMYLNVCDNLVTVSFKHWTSWIISQDYQSVPLEQNFGDVPSPFYHIQPNGHLRHFVLTGRPKDYHLMCKVRSSHVLLNFGNVFFTTTRVLDFILIARFCAAPYTFFTVRQGSSKIRSHLDNCLLFDQSSNQRASSHINTDITSFFIV